jgi:hypothetical protein
MKKILTPRLQDRFAYLVRVYLEENNLGQGTLAANLGIQRTHLNMLLNSKRILSAHYLEPFLIGGMMAVKDIYDGKPETSREAKFWATMDVASRKALIDNIIEIESMGGDVEEITKLWLMIKKKGYDPKVTADIK